MRREDIHQIEARGIKRIPVLTKGSLDAHPSKVQAKSEVLAPQAGHRERHSESDRSLLVS